ncbi:MAG: hypothetical protein LBQ68_04360 [Clostridiales bacterium]|nr:hypothetical protein [Clostridiales bacterium]
MFSSKPVEIPASQIPSIPSFSNIAEIPTDEDVAYFSGEISAEEQAAIQQAFIDQQAAQLQAKKQELAQQAAQLSAAQQAAQLYPAQQVPQLSAAQQAAQLYATQQAAQLTQSQIPSVANYPSAYTYPTANNYVAAPLSYGPYYVGSTRPFWINSGGGAAQATGYLIAQGLHTNIWIIQSDPAYQYFTSEMATDMVSTMEGIYARMTDPIAGLGTHANVTVTTNYPEIPIVGDIDNDGRINFILYDINGDGDYPYNYQTGLFDPYDFYYGEQSNLLDCVHVDIGLNQSYLNLLDEEYKYLTYGQMAHEFQHLLFFMYFEIYLEESSVMDQYLWINECMSEFTHAYYTHPNMQLNYDTEKVYSSLQNTYLGDQPSDFFNFFSDKNYGMAYIYSIFMNNITGGSFAHNLYAYIKTAFPVATTVTQYEINYANANSRSMTSTLGDMFYYATGVGSGGDDTFIQLYFKFMENFLADGGYIHDISSAAPEPTLKFLNDPTGITDFWMVRPILGAADFTDFDRIPELASGGTINLNGYNAVSGYASTASTTFGSINASQTASLYPTHDMLYRLYGAGAAYSPVLQISIPADSDTTRYYVAVPNASTAAGAEVYRIYEGINNYILTNNSPVYLFAATLYNPVNTTVTYSWVQSATAQRYSIAGVPTSRVSVSSANLDLFTPPKASAAASPNATAITSPNFRISFRSTPTPTPSAAFRSVRP